MPSLFATPATTFLTLLAAGSILLLALPMIFAPLAWARMLRWRLPEHTDLAVYFGRSLGCVVLGLSLAALYATAHAELLRPMFLLMVFNFAAMVLVHLWGAWRRIQPLSETLETLVWAALLALALWLMP